LEIIRKLWIGIQIPEEYKENFDVSSEGASSGNNEVLLIYFSDSCIPMNLKQDSLEPISKYTPIIRKLSLAISDAE
jgi:hypothetical protein